MARARMPMSYEAWEGREGSAYGNQLLFKAPRSLTFTIPIHIASRALRSGRSIPMAPPAATSERLPVRSHPSSRFYGTAGDADDQFPDLMATALKSSDVSTWAAARPHPRSLGLAMVIEFSDPRRRPRPERHTAIRAICHCSHAWAGSKSA